MTASSNGVLWREELHERHRKEKLEMYLFAMKEDLSEWLAGLMNIDVSAESFMDVLDNGIHLCRLANMIQRAAEKHMLTNPGLELKLPTFVATHKERGASYGSFVSRDNVANFIRWCRELGIPDVIMFESEDLVLHRFQKPVILALLDVARRAAKFDIEPPDLVKMEEQIDEEIALEQEALQSQHRCPHTQQDTANDVTCEATDNNTINHETKIVNGQQMKPKLRQNTSGPTGSKAKTKNFIPKNLDTLVKETVQQCTCADNQFPVEKIADGKYTIGENRVLIFVRVMRNHVMVRVGGGWDTLENYIQKHDPCRAGGRCGSGGRRKSRCPTPNFSSTGENGLQSSSATSVASSDSGSSTSSSSRLSPNPGTSLQGMVCVFGESGPRTEVLRSGDSSPSGTPYKRFDTPPVKSDSSVSKRGALTSKSANAIICNGVTKRNGQKSAGNESPRSPTSGGAVAKQRQTPDNKLTGRETLNTLALRKSLQEADLTFSRSRTSDAILSRPVRRTRNKSREQSPVVKRRGDISREQSPAVKRQGNISRETSSDNMKRESRATTGPRRSRRNSEGRKRSPDVRKRSAVSPAPVSARRRLEAEYDTKTPDLQLQKRNALRKDLNENSLFFSRSFSADTIQRSSATGLQFRSRIPVPVTAYGKRRGSRAGEDNGLPEHPSNASLNQNSNESLMTRSHRCGENCTCDEGFIDGEISRSAAVRPTSLFPNDQKQTAGFEGATLNPRSPGAGAGLQNGGYLRESGGNSPQDLSGNGLNGSGGDDRSRSKKPLDVTSSGSWESNKASENGIINSDSDSLEWKEVMTDILKFEENRIGDKNF